MLPKKMKKKYKQVKTIKDLGDGKSAALNLAVSKAKGDILILTDGDVYVGKDSIGKLVQSLKYQKVGAVTGRPVSLNPRGNKFGYWAYLLTEIAHERRKLASKKGMRFFCSGYLFAIRKKLFPKLQINLLSEDGYISHRVYEKGYRIDYSEDSRVLVRYPTNFEDWIKQKRRSAGGYRQLNGDMGIEIRSFRKE